MEIARSSDRTAHSVQKNRRAVGDSALALPSEVFVRHDENRAPMAQQQQQKQHPRRTSSFSTTSTAEQGKELWTVRGTARLAVTYARSIFYGTSHESIIFWKRF
jgi:hypothetical protein